ncbi:MAG: ATPase [Alphaproteobacteria bacterium]|nr:ATPase [Alphaproteobacteria bacterium]MBV9373563.1 ATPase [Alphaproteobacteria bacterium]
MKQANLPPQRRAATRRTAGYAQEDHVLDPYQQRGKLHNGTLCPQCGAVYHEGRWRWAPASGGADKSLCAACRRINDNLPAGILKLRGIFGQQQTDEIVRLARHQEDAEKQEHPLNRIIGVEEEEEAIVIKTTDIHLPRRIGAAVRRAFHGRLTEDFDAAGYLVRVTWTVDR